MMQSAFFISLPLCPLHDYRLAILSFQWDILVHEAFFCVCVLHHFASGYCIQQQGARSLAFLLVIYFFLLSEGRLSECPMDEKRERY